VLHHDNAPAHASLLICEFLTKNETTVVPQPAYSPDLTPADFFLFPKLKSTLKGRRFESTEEIEENLLTELRAIPKKKSFQDCFQNCKKTLGKLC
jgi:transposase